MWNELIKYPFYVTIHPFKGFWDVKYEGKGKARIAMAILFLLTIVIILKRQFTGFIVNFSNPNQLNSVDELTFIILPFFLFCIANWAITTLMDWGREIHRNYYCYSLCASANGNHLRCNDNN